MRLFSTETSSFILHKKVLSGERSLREQGLPISANVRSVFSEDLSPTFYLKKSLHLYQQGLRKDEVKLLFLSIKCLKKSATSLPQDFSTLYFWGTVLWKIGEKTGDISYFSAAYEKYLDAKTHIVEESPSVLADFYTQLGTLETLLAEKSGEAIDIRFAIKSFRSSLRYQKNPAPSFWIAFGKAYYQMGLFVNDNRHYLQAIGHFTKALEYEGKNPAAWILSASAYKELYINTSSEKYFKQASLHYQHACQYDDLNEEIWLEWAAILHESGKINEDPKKLRLSIEKCIRAHSLEPNSPRVIGQWIESLSLLGSLSSRHDLIIEAENKAIKATSSFPESPEVWYAYAVCLGAQATYYEDPAFYDFAIEKIQQGLWIDSSIAELWCLLAFFHHRLGSHFSDQKLLRLAEKFYQKTASLKPACPQVIFQRARNLLELAELLENAQYARQAYETLEHLIHFQKDSLLDHPEWLFAYASSLYTLGEISSNETFLMRSVEVFWQVLLIEPEFPQIHRKLAITFSQLADFSTNTVLYQKAFHYFEISVQKDPENQETWLEWGLSLIQHAHLTYDTKKEFSIYLDAEKKIRKAGELGSEHAFYHLACLYSLMGKFTDAMHLLEMAKERDVLPPLTELIEDDWLEALRATPKFSQFVRYLEQKEKL